jgi:hypothetical protein
MAKSKTRQIPNSLNVTIKISPYFTIFPVNSDIKITMENTKRSCSKRSPLPNALPYAQQNLPQEQATISWETSETVMFLSMPHKM